VLYALLFICYHLYNVNVQEITVLIRIIIATTCRYLITDKVITIIKCICRNSTQISVVHDRENGRFYDRQSPTFFNLDIYSALSWSARALRAHYIVTSIESVSLKAIVVSLGDFY